MKGLTEKQKKLPPALQKAILASSNRTKDDKKKDDKKTKPKMPPKPKRKY